MLKIEVYILKFHTDSEFHSGFAQKRDFDDFPIFFKKMLGVCVIYSHYLRVIYSHYLRVNCTTIICV